MLTRVCLIAVAACLAASASMHSQTDYIAGQRWLRLDPDSRLVWLWGAAEGQSLLMEELPRTATTGLKNVIALDSADVISNIMTQYYRDASNAYIPWKYLAVVAKMKLEGATETSVNQRLQALREYSVQMRSKK